MRDQDEYIFLSLTEVTRSFGVTTEMIVEIVDQGIVSPQAEPPEEWTFDNAAIRRIRTALQLHRDLGVNVAGAALALDLLDEINRLQSQVRKK